MGLALVAELLVVLGLHGAILPFAAATEL